MNMNMVMKTLRGLLPILLLALPYTLRADSGDAEHAPAAVHAEEEHGHDHEQEENHAEDEHEEEAGHAEEEHGHGHGDEHGGHEEGVIRLTEAQMQMAGVRVTPLRKQSLSQVLQAPGEVRFNAYKTVKITPRIAAQVVGRSVRLGDEVKRGQVLLTLSSVEMAEAQGQYLVALREWQRVKKLGRKVVSERRYTEAKVNMELARGRIQAYGMTPARIDRLQSDQGGIANGIFRLLAPQAGRVLHDDFIVGERVEAGRELMVIADESLMWVEARVTPEDAGHIPPGADAWVRVNGERIAARVSQLSHTLDETTRTLAVRIEVPNIDDHLHPGMFVSTEIATRKTAPALALPEAAVLRSPDGDWQVLVQQDEAGEFRAQEVRLLRVSNGQAVIEGIKPGTPVVTAGAFFVQSELAKSGFEVHNH